MDSMFPSIDVDDARKSAHGISPVIIAMNTSAL